MIASTFPSLPVVAAVARFPGRTSWVFATDCFSHAPATVKISLVMILCFLWNPRIRKSLFPPRPISLFPENSLQTNCDFGLGFDSGADDYKMLAVVKSLGSDFSLEQLSIGFQLYSLDANSWKIINSIDHDYKGVEFDALAFAFVSGFLHIIGFQRIASKNDINAGGDDSTSNKFCNFIVAFDVGKETFAKILLPESLAHAKPYLCSIWAYRDFSIAVAEYNLLAAQYNLWVMGRYGLEDSWTKLVIKDGLPNCRVCYLLAFRNNGELIVRRTCGETEAAKFCRRHILM